MLLKEYGYCHIFAFIDCRFKICSMNKKGKDLQAHVHPSFSPKGNYICYTSDRTGVPQVYVVPVGDITHAQ